MNTKTLERMPNVNKYDVSVAILIVLAAIFILGVCIWFGPASESGSDQSVHLNSSTR